MSKEKHTQFFKVKAIIGYTQSKLRLDGVQHDEESFYVEWKDSIVKEDDPFLTKKNVRKVKKIPKKRQCKVQWKPNWVQRKDFVSEAFLKKLLIKYNSKTKDPENRYVF
eukprot:jgi/Bigna1/129904/aug1.10_g4612